MDALNKKYRVFFSKITVVIIIKQIKMDHDEITVAIDTCWRELTKQKSKLAFNIAQTNADSLFHKFKAFELQTVKPRLQDTLAVDLQFQELPPMVRLMLANITKWTKRKNKATMIPRNVEYFLLCYESLTKNYRDICSSISKSLRDMADASNHFTDAMCKAHYVCDQLIASQYQSLFESFSSRMNMITLLQSQKITWERNIMSSMLAHVNEKYTLLDLNCTSLLAITSCSHFQERQQGNNNASVVIQQIHSRLRECMSAQQCSIVSLSHLESSPIHIHLDHIVRTIAIVDEITTLETNWRTDIEVTIEHILKKYEQQTIENANWSRKLRMMQSEIAQAKKRREDAMDAAIRSRATTELDRSITSQAQKDVVDTMNKYNQLKVVFHVFNKAYIKLQNLELHTRQWKKKSIISSGQVLLCVEQCNEKLTHWANLTDLFTKERSMVETDFSSKVAHMLTTQSDAHEKRVKSLMLHRDAGRSRIGNEIRSLCESAKQYNQTHTNLLQQVQFDRTLKVALFKGNDICISLNPNLQFLYDFVSNNVEFVSRCAIEGYVDALRNIIFY